MSDEALRLRYALAKQVPDMHRAVTLHTNYGDITLHGRDAERVAVLVQRLLESRLRQVERHQERLSCAAADPETSSRLERSGGAA